MGNIERELLSLMNFKDSFVCPRQAWHIYSVALAEQWKAFASHNDNVLNIFIAQPREMNASLPNVALLNIQVPLSQMEK